MRYSPEAHRLGLQEGRGIFGAIAKAVKGGANFLKKHNQLRLQVINYQDLKVYHKTVNNT